MLAFILLFASVFASCGTNPYFYMTGFLPPLDEAANAAATHKACPTTHSAGKPSCCTASFLDTVIGQAKMVGATLGTAYDFMNLAINSDIPELYVTIQSLQADKCMFSPAGLDKEDLSESILKQAQAIFLKDNGDDLVKLVEKNWKGFRPVVAKLARRTADVMHGLVCEACNPARVATFDEKDPKEDIDMYSIFDKIPMYMKQDDFAGIAQVFTQNKVEKMLIKLQSELKAITSEKHTISAINKALTVCKVKETDVDMDYLTEEVAGEYTMPDVKIDKALVTMLSDLIGQNTMPVIQVIMNKVVVPFKSLGFTEPKQIKDIYKIAKSYFKSCDDLAGSFAAIMADKMPTGKGCAITGDVQKLMPLMGLMAQPPFVNSDEVKDYATKHGLYVKENLEQLRTGSDADDRNVDLFRLAKSTASILDEEEIWTMPKVFVSKKPEQAARIADADEESELIVNYDTEHYSSAVGPIAVAAESTVSFSDDIDFASASLGLGALAGLVSMVLAMLL